MGQEDYNYLHNIGCNMSGSPTEDIDPYYDCKIRPTTPTMVLNFVLPNSRINKDGPFLEIYQQPQSKFRFRYMSEMNGTHGQLKAESADKNKNLYPTVKLCNWNKGSALIQLQLYTAEKNANDRKKHVHELNGKYVNKAGLTGGCEVIVNEENDYTATFPNLGIIHIAKRDVSNIIYQRKRQEKVNSGMKNGHVKHNISPTDLKKLEIDAKEEAKGMNLNKVVLRYQAFWHDDKLGEYVPITDYIDSDVIFNLKNAQTGELKMVRLSAVSAPCTGGTEVWMLVEKVKKDDVKIKFFETDPNGVEVWKSYGEFKQSDVHHQFTIVFKTPAYRFTNIRQPVHVKVQLERPSDGENSDILDFQYTPEILKRTIPFEDTNSDIEANPYKRQRNVLEPVNLKTGKNLFLVARETDQVSQSPTQRVPSPITYIASPSSQVFYSPPHSSPQPSYNTFSEDSNYGLVGSEQVQVGQHSYDQLLENQRISNCQISFNAPSPNNFALTNSPTTISSSPQNQNFADLLSPNYQQEVPVLSPNYNQMSPYSQQASPYNQEPMLSPYSKQTGVPAFVYQSKSPNFMQYQEVNSPVAILPESGIEQIQQCDAVIQQVIQSHNDVVPFADSDFSNLLSKPSPTNQSQQCDLFEFITKNENMFMAPPSSSMELQADCSSFSKSKSQTASTVKSPHSLIRARPSSSVSDVDAITSKIASVSIQDDKLPVRNSEASTEHEKVSVKGSFDVAFDVAVRAADCLQNYAATGDIGLLLATHRYLLAVQNRRGDNALHTAISYHNWDAFNKILDASVEIFCKDILNATNYSGETPLHMAVHMNDIHMTRKLLSIPECDITIADVDGNTPLHIAASLKSHQCLAAILNHGTIEKIINEYNYQGETCLHRAVQSGNLNSVTLLLKNGADVHLCERKRGANSMHLAVIGGNVQIVQYFTEKTNVTVDAGMFDGNTALHIAAQSSNAQICSILMKAKANPSVTNGLRKSKSDSDGATDDEENCDSSEEENETENDYFSPLDYADGNEEIISILKGEMSVDKLDSGVDLQSEDLGSI